MIIQITINKHIKEYIVMSAVFWVHVFTVHLFILKEEVGEVMQALGAQHR